MPDTTWLSGIINRDTQRQKQGNIHPALSQFRPPALRYHLYIKYVFTFVDLHNMNIRIDSQHHHLIAIPHQITQLVCVFHHNNCDYHYYVHSIHSEMYIWAFCHQGPECWYSAGLSRIIKSLLIYCHSLSIGVLLSHKGCSLLYDKCHCELQINCIKIWHIGVEPLITPSSVIAQLLVLTSVGKCARISRVIMPTI